jgi:hypothetical protein
MPESAIPLMKCFWARKKRSIVGIDVIKDAAIMMPCIPTLPAPLFRKPARATGRFAIS